MKKKFIGMLMSLALQSYGAQAPLEGFTYGEKEAPTGSEWEAPQNIAHNKEQPRSTFYSFDDVKSARKVLPENSDFWQSLDGEWKFNWVKHPDLRPKNFHQTNFDTSSWDNISVPSNWNLAGLQKDGSQKYGTPIYCNQPVIFKHSVRVDDWKGGVMRTPPKNWTTFDARNEVGSYRRDFTIPADWDGREVFVQFDGVDSFFYLWINGQYIGFSKNSRNAAIFNISKYIKKGQNIIAAEVYRNSDGSFLEAQDMFRLPGIFRSVALYSTPKVHIRDLFVVPDLDDNYQDAKLAIKADIRNLSGEAVTDHKISYSLFENELYSDDNSKVKNAKAQISVEKLAPQANATTVATMAVKAPNKWSAELPYRYTLVAELKDQSGETIETVSTYIGFREVEIKETKAQDDEFGLAGRYYYLNGKTIKLKGVNRHETTPETGHTLTRQQMEEEIMLLKRGNINHVRNSHYPPNPYWYYLCDKYGIYLEDEANIESHQYYYGAASLSHPPEWKNAHVSRVMEMLHQNKNYASIVIWSLGNEAGPGKNFVHAYDALKAVDSSRPVQYERNNNIVDMGSNQYPSIGWVNAAVQGKMNIKYPFHISEYAHSMGNACGNLIDYWNAIESTNFFCGGAIWDWVDQSLYNYDRKTGERYLAYGGDFGDMPNDGQFVMNGIIFAERDPKPQYYEVKKVYQEVGIKALDLQKNSFEIFNKHYFKSLEDYDLIWSLYENGKKIDDGDIDTDDLAPRSTKKFVLDLDREDFKADAEYFVKIQLILDDDQPWAEEDFVQAEEQILIQKASSKTSVATSAKEKAPKSKITIVTDKNLKTISGDNFSAKFDLLAGTIHELTYGDNTIIAAGNGPKLDAFRAFTNNDNWIYRNWFDRGLHNLKDTVLDAKVRNHKNGTVTLAFTIKSQAPNAAQIHGGTSSGRNHIEELPNRKFGEDNFHFTTNQIWTVYQDGSIELQSSITSNEAGLILPRLGYAMNIPQDFSKLTYYGRGPIESYADRKTSQFIEKFSTTVADEFANFPKPQDMANREDVRWCALTNEDGEGAVFIATEKLSISALPYSAMDLMLAPHPYQLPPAGDTVLHLDSVVTGLGGNSCGQGGPLQGDRAYAGLNNMGFIIRPAGKKLGKIANVAPAGQVPISISRSRAGMVSISTSKANAQLLYSINDGKAQTYTKELNLRAGGAVKAWYKGDKDSQTSISYAKIDRIDTTVVFTSSQEPGSGNAAKNLTDGNSNSIWHTMYSVTVAQYPHWVDFDSGVPQKIKGFVYLPRQNGDNGDIKDFTIQISLDGKKWSKVIHKGRFARSKKEQRILFKEPIKARFVRFTGLSSQNGQDFASGAEFTILAD